MSCIWSIGRVYLAGVTATSKGIEVERSLSVRFGSEAEAQNEADGGLTKARLNGCYRPEADSVRQPGRLFRAAKTVTSPCARPCQRSWAVDITHQLQRFLGVGKPAIAEFGDLALVS